MVLLAVIPYIACFILYRFFFFFKAVDLFSSLLLFSLSLSFERRIENKNKNMFKQNNITIDLEKRFDFQIHIYYISNDNLQI